MENQNTQNLAKRVAILLQESEKRNDDFFRASLENINRRLDAIESNLAFRKPKTENRKPKLNHFSQEKFTNLKELAAETMNGLKDEKACPFEPAGKPCDHCAMCDSRGF